VNPKSWTGRPLHAAWHETDYDRAKKQLLTTVSWLGRLSRDAASARDWRRRSPPELLRKTLATTNAIESALSVTGTFTARVTRWRDGNMRQRCCTARLLRAKAEVPR
jgi:hypothetical protein